MMISTRVVSATALLCVFACSDPECPAGTMMGPGVCKVPEAGKPASVAGAGGRGGAFAWPRFDDAGAGRGGAGSDAVEEDAGADASKVMVKACGNGLLDPGEACDFDCPTDCDTGNKCLVGRLEGSADECSATCKQERVTECTNGDGCCADGCNAENDDDCSATCGNGTVEDQETCDGDCPTSCDDGEACTVDMQTGKADQCSIVCMHEPARANRTPDGCCPAGANVTTDPDCPQRCGDGVVTGDETCDPMSSRKCPASCDDGNPCTDDVLEGDAATCGSRCRHTPKSAGATCDGTGFCDEGGECVQARCGDGIVNERELCDGNCPTSCSAENECTTSTLAGTFCQRRCLSGNSPAGTFCFNDRGACDGQGQCARNIWYQGCVSNTACAGALTCQLSRTICTTECTADDQCGISPTGTGGVCMNGWCEQPCNEDRECRVGQMCMNLAGIKRCRPKPCVPDPMTSEPICRGGGSCREDATGVMICIN